MNCLSVFDHFAGFALEGLTMLFKVKHQLLCFLLWLIQLIQEDQYKWLPVISTPTLTAAVLCEMGLKQSFQGDMFIDYCSFFIL